MTILVPIKRVVDPYAKVKPLADGSAIDTSGVKFEINPFDEIALEEAVRIKETHGDVTLLAVSIGASECEDQLRKGLAMGADRAILVETDAPLDSPAVAALLAEVVHAENPDMVLMGKQATDDDCGQAAQMLAAKLGWPQATFAAKVSVDGTSVKVVRETDSGGETLNLPLPAVVTADLRLNEPRYIALPGIIKARSKPLDRRTPGSVPAVRTRRVKLESPPSRAAGQKVADVDALIEALRAKGAPL